MSRVDNYAIIRDLCQSQVSLPVSMLGLPGDGVLNVGAMFQFVSKEFNELDSQKSDLEQKVTDADAKRKNLADMLKLAVESQGGELKLPIPTPENTEGKELKMVDDGKDTLVLAVK